MVVENEDAVGREVIISGKRITREKIMHRFVELNPHWRILVVEQKKHPGAVLFPHADLDVFRNFKQGMEIARRAKP